MDTKSVIEESKSSLVLQKIYVEKMSYERNQVMDSPVKFVRSNISKDISPLDENVYKCSICMTMIDESGECKLEVVVTGNFELNENMEKQKKEVIMTRNTMAILFPYLRTQMTLLTSQPDMVPVVLPAININALLANID